MTALGALDPAVAALQRSNLLTQALLVADSDDIPALAAQARDLVREQESAIDRLVALGGKVTALPDLLGHPNAGSAGAGIDALEALRRASHPAARAMLEYLRAAQESAAQISPEWEGLIGGTLMYLASIVEPASAGGME